MAPLEVNLVSAERKVWSGEAQMVSAPSIEGEMGILSGHAPVLAVLRAGTVRITDVGGTTHAHRVDSGFLSVDSDHVTVVVDAAQDAGPTTAARH